MLTVRVEDTEPDGERDAEADLVTDGVGERLGETEAVAEGAIAKTPRQVCLSAAVEKVHKR